jgi:Trk K+ transport system NAD-binding subunit
VGELDLVALLRSGVPVEIADGQRIMIGKLRAASPLAHTSIAASGRHLVGPDTTIIAVLRGEHMMAPRADAELLPGDRLILVVSDQSAHAFDQHLEPW